MPNNKYLRSTKRERQLVNGAKEAGLVGLRTAGSHGEFDVIVWDRKNKTLEFIQVKTQKGSKDCVIKDKVVYSGVTVIEATYSWEKKRG